MVSDRTPPFRQTDHPATSWRDVAGAWAMIILFLLVVLLGLGLDRVVTLAP